MTARTHRSCGTEAKEHPLMAKAVTLLANILRDFPDASILLIGIGHPEGVECGSYPNAHTVRKGMVMDLAELVCATLPE